MDSLYIFSLLSALRYFVCYYVLINMSLLLLLLLDKEVTVDSFDVYPRQTHWHCYFCHLSLFEIWLFFDLWPLNHRLNGEVTVDNFGPLSKVNMLTLLLFPFEVVCDLTPNHRSDKEVFVDFFRCWSHANILTLLLLSFELV